MVETVEALQDLLRVYGDFAPGACLRIVEAARSGDGLSRATRIELGMVAGRLAKRREQSRAPEVGRALFPFVYDTPFTGGQDERSGPGVGGELLGIRGNLARVVASVEGPRGAPEGFEPLDDGDPGRRRIEAWLLREIGGGTHPRFSLSLSIERPPQGMQRRGRSWEGAALVAAVSALLGEAPRVAPILSATLEDTGTAEGAALGPVDRVSDKRHIVDAEAPGEGGCVWLVDSDPMDPRWVLEELFGAGWDRRLRARFGPSPWALVREARSAAERGRWEEARRKALWVREAPEPSPLERARALAVLGEDDLHRGAVSWALGHLEEARALYADLGRTGRGGGGEPAGLPPEPHELERLLVRLAVARLDTLRPEDARGLLDLARRALDERPPAWRDDRWRMVDLEVRGTSSRVLVALDRLGAAEEVRRALVEPETGPLVPEEAARNLMELAELARRHQARAAAQPGGAAEAGGDAPARWLREAEARLGDALHVDNRERTHRFLRLYSVRAGLASPAYEVAEPRWADWPQPAEVLETLLHAGPEALEGWLRGHWLEGSAPGPAGPADPPEAIFGVLALSACARGVVGWASGGSSAAPSRAEPRGLLGVSRDLARQILQRARDARQPQGPIGQLLRQTAAARPTPDSLAPWIWLSPY